MIDNYPEGQVEMLDAVNNPEDPGMGTRQVPFSRELYIEQDDFREDPPKQFFRLAPGREVRLRWAYLITCTDVVKDPKTGEVVELHCTYDPATRGGNTPDGRKVKGTIHWVSADHAHAGRSAALRSPFHQGRPGRRAAGAGLQIELEPQLVGSGFTACLVEPSLATAAAGQPLSVRAAGLFLRRSRLDVPASRSSTAPCHSATPGRRSRRGRSREIHIKKPRMKHGLNTDKGNSMELPNKGSHRAGDRN